MSIFLHSGSANVARHTVREYLTVDDSTHEGVCVDKWEDIEGLCFANPFATFGGLFKVFSGYEITISSGLKISKPMRHVHSVLCQCLRAVKRRYVDEQAEYTP